MRRMNWLARVFLFYYEGFRGMTIGRTLWLVVIVKLFIIFFVLKLFFFPNFLSSQAEGHEAEYVATQLTDVKR